MKSAPLPKPAVMLADLGELLAFLERQPSRCAWPHLVPARLAYLTWTGADCARSRTLRELRDGVGFKSTGWGWRVRKGAREALAAKVAALVTP